MNTPLKLSLHGSDPSSRARTGAITVRGRTFETPAYMPVGTAATVKAMLPESVAATGADILAVACPYCLQMFEDSVKTMDLSLEVKDVAELLADAL